MSPAQQTTLVQDLIALARYGLMGRRGKFIIGGGFAIGGLFFGWDWLVAAGLAPILLTVLPCAAMCGLGLCMNREGGKSCSSTPTDAGGANENPQIKCSTDSNSGQSAREIEKR